MGRRVSRKAGKRVSKPDGVSSPVTLTHLPAYQPTRFITADAAEYMIDRGVVLVGIDSLNIDDTGNLARPVHSTLLGDEVPIVEHLCNLSNLPERDFRFFAAPAKVAGFGTWPVRAFAHVLPSD